ncbi:MAG: aldose epimerase family protein [Gemmiger sp.]|uniref:aldose epimerase family protein n=1 Tax=Gemmiger sp. TaxID=2049027 RepID=UPI002A90A335|nr:aldose epimerase family protein [Gemmiger sp.]MDY5327312.1 aldose epimerase family protein [Gemmiger sp.]
MSVVIRNFGKTTDGRPVREAVLSNQQMEVHILSYAAVIHKLLVPDRKGRMVDVVLGYPTVQDYELNPDGMGAVVGRYANRIGGARFPLYGEIVHVTPNENGNCLHSGLHGFHHAVFRMVEDGDAVVLTAVSPDGTDGFPGEVELEVRYSLAGSGLVIQYTAATDAPTVVNITNHSYFNLNGHASGSVLGHRLAMDARAYLETDEHSIPSGRRIPVAGTPMDFTEEKTLGRDIGEDYSALHQGHGYDHCFVVPDSGLRHVAWLTGPETGIRMETLSTQPGVQVYSANYLTPNTPCKDGAHYAPRDAVCLETQEFPDAPNHPDFPDTTVLPETPYSATTVYRFDLAPQ